MDARIVPNVSEEKIRWVIDVKGNYLGKCFATEDEIRAAVGPYASFVGNGINIWGRP